MRYSVSKIWTQKTGRPFGIYWSEKLGFGRLWPEPTDGELASFYDIDSYNNYLSGTPNKESDGKAGLLSRAIVKLAWLSDHSEINPVDTILSHSPAARTVCDIGCGSGAFLDIMRQRGLVPAGVDPNQISGEALVARGIEFFNGTAERLPISGRSFDVVTMFQSLEHCRNPMEAVRNAVKLLSLDGLLVIDVPNMGCIGFEKYGAAWWHTDAGRHMQFFTQQSLSALLQLAGATPIKWEFEGFTTGFSRRWINDMAAVWDSIKPATPRPSQLRSASYLPTAMLSAPSLKYEIIRVYARAKNSS